MYEFICFNLDTFSEQFGYYGLNVYDVIYNYYQNNSWFMETDGLYQEVIKLGLTDGNMFYNPHFFHNSSILDFSAQVCINISLTYIFVCN